MDFTSNLRLDSDQSINEYRNIVFRVGGILILPDLKQLTHLFRLKLKVVTVRYDKRNACNRATRCVSYNISSSRKSSSIT